jgi:ceramide glucosyltransferase
MNAAIILASAYLGQLGVKAFLADRYARQVRCTPPPPAAVTVSIVQPILGGDPALADALESNITALDEASFLWLVDEDDRCAQTTCEQLVAKYPTRSLKILRCPAPPQGVNPKAFKLHRALSKISSVILVVLDDDTRLSASALRALLAGLNSGAALATGLPRYHPANGRYSAWLAEFVNSAAALTYLPTLAFSEPLSIHGMCYAMRTADARQWNVFQNIERALTDDLALAQHLQTRGLRVFQTVEPHDIATTVATPAALLRILHRWFVFTRLLLDTRPVPTRLAVAVCYGVPPVLLWSLIMLAPHSLVNAGALLGAVVLRGVIVCGVKRRFLRLRATGPLLVSLLMELAHPLLLAAAYCRTTIQWRTRTIRVHAIDRFEYV